MIYVKPQDLAVDDLLLQLLQEADGSKRKALYNSRGQWPELNSGLELTSALKVKVDSYKHTDGAKALLAGRRAFEVSEWTNEPRAKPQGYWALAIGLSAQGYFEEALGHFESARRLYRDLNLEIDAAKVALGQLQPLAMTGKLQEARGLAETIRHTFSRHACKPEEGKTNNNLGIIYTALGQFEQAERALERALTIHTQEGNREETMLSHINLGDVCQEQDRFKDAAAHLHTALAIAQELEKSRPAAGTMVNLALLYRRQGRLGEALELLTQARELYSSEDSNDAALAQLEEARVDLDLNLLNEAKSLAENLIDTFTENEMKMEQAEVLTLLGNIQTKLKQPSEARTVLEEAQKLWQDLGNKVQASLHKLYLASLYLQTGEPSNALELAQNATTFFGDRGGLSSTTLGLLISAEAQLVLGKPASARQTLEHAAVQARELGIVNLLVRSAYLLGKVAYKQGRLADAEQHYREAIHELEGTRATLAIDEFKAAYLGDKLSVYDDLVLLLVEQGRIHEAFTFVERAKSRTLLELLAKSVSTKLPIDDTRIRELSRRLKEAREDLHWHVLGAEEEVYDAARREKIRACELEITTILRDLERLQPEAAALEHVTASDFATLNEQVEEGTVLIEYFGSGDTLSAFVVSRTEIRCVTHLASLSEVEQDLKRLEFYFNRVALGGVHAEVYGERLQRRIGNRLSTLYERLIAPLNLTLDGNRLIIVPHDSLYAVPFAALYDGREYLIDRARISLAPSASVYRFCKTKATQPQGALLALGVPSDSLPAVQEEIETIAEGFEGANVFSGSSANKATFFERAPTASILHIATHGSYRPDNPMFSGLRLADGWLNARDLYGIHLQASLVVLSACESGLTQSYGLEPFGLIRGFLHAGAPALVTSLWPIKDKQTTEFMRSFYRALKSGEAVDAALRAAQLESRSQYPNPYYWASFNVLGDAARSVIFDP